METERLTDLLREWLEKELERPEFEVFWMEKKVELNIAGLQLQLKVDRMDQTSNGHKIVFDYKTGKASPAGWYKDRIQDPQVPLYQLQTQADAALFAKIRKGNCSYQGAAQMARDILRVPVSGGNAPKDFSSWDELTAFWKTSLEELTREFLSGLAVVQPFNKVQTCNYCHLPTLCRKDEVFEDLTEEEE